MKKIEQIYDLEFKIIRDKVNNIYNKNKNESDKILEIIKCWAKDVAVLKAKIKYEIKAKEHFRKNEVKALLELNSHNES